LRGGDTRTEMGLRSDTVDGYASGDPGLDLRGESSGLRVRGAVEVEVIDVQLGVRVGLLGGVEGDLDVALADYIEEDVGLELAIFAEDLVDDVPSVAFAGVTTSNGRNVVLERSSQLGGVGDGADPGWELVVPKKVVWFDL